MPAAGKSNSSGDLAYLIAAGARRYRWAAWWAVRALRRLGDFRGEIVVLSDRRYEFGEYARCMVVPTAVSPDGAKVLKLRAREHIDFAAYQRVLFVDCDIVVARTLEGLMAQARREHALVATDDLRQRVGVGANWRCLDRAEIDANASRLAANSGCFAAPGSALAGWLESWEDVLEASHDRQGPGFDQPGLNACMVREIFPVRLEPGLMWFPKLDPERKLCDADPALAHFHGIDRHINRLWRMRSYAMRRERENTRGSRIPVLSGGDAVLTDPRPVGAPTSAQ